MRKTMMFIAVLGLAFTACKKEGCTDATATNYDEKADENDGSCMYSTPVDTSSNGGGTDTTTTPQRFEYITKASMDSAKWKNTWLLPYSDASIGFDFSTMMYVDSTRDGYLDMATMTFENKSLFGGQNKVLDLGNLDENVDYKLTNQWNTTNSKLAVGEYYLVQCQDGYAIFKIKSFMTCCDEYEMDFIFVPASELEVK